MEKNGFYKLEDTILLSAANFVCGTDFELNIQDKDIYIYPIDGWYYFDSEVLAKNFFGIVDKPKV